MVLHCRSQRDLFKYTRNDIFIRIYTSVYPLFVKIHQFRQKKGLFLLNPTKIWQNPISHRLIIFLHWFLNFWDYSQLSTTLVGEVIANRKLVCDEICDKICGKTIDYFGILLHHWLYITIVNIAHITRPILTIDHYW